MFKWEAWGQSQWSRTVMFLVQCHVLPPHCQLSIVKGMKAFPENFRENIDNKVSVYYTSGQSQRQQRSDDFFVSVPTVQVVTLTRRCRTTNVMRWQHYEVWCSVHEYRWSLVYRKPTQSYGLGQCDTMNTVRGCTGPWLTSSEGSELVQSYSTLNVKHDCCQTQNQGSGIHVQVVICNRSGGGLLAKIKSRLSRQTA